MSTRLDLLSNKNQDTFAKEEDNKDVFEFEESSDVIQKEESQDVIEGSELQTITSTDPSQVTPLDTSQGKLSKKDLLKDKDYFEEILQYREDRFGTDKKVGAAYVMIPFLKQDLTQENIIDDYLDHYRFITSNEIDVIQELDWLKSIQKKEQMALTNARNSKVQKEQNAYLAEAKKLSEMIARAAT